MSRTHVVCTINGDEVEFLADDDQSWLDALRDEVQLTGTKEGCGTGDCGACSVIIDGRLTCSCLVFAPEVAGSSVVTVEGLADGDRLHQGGVVQGIGWALNEEYIYDEYGVMENPGFLDYRMPVASDLPMIDTVIVEVPNPGHPYGVRGVGEVGIVPPIAAVANAIYEATGHRLRDLPMSPVRVLDAITG